MNNDRTLTRRMAEINNRIKLMVRRCRLGVVNDENPVQTVEAGIYKNEFRSGVERIQEYGLSTVPPEGGQAVVAFLGGEGSHPVVIATDDRRYRPRKRKPGDVSLYTDQADHGVFLTSDGRGVLIRGLKITVHADDEVVVNAPKIRVLGHLEVTGDILDMSRGTGRTMATMRKYFDNHVHKENDHGGPTDPPREKMG
ncbi:MAG: phage baseplate assembly protein V [Planctomycetaceae bacterium]|nr:phage baseplate assembly protein V [Planctomycetaceae bacterium]